MSSPPGAPVVPFVLGIDLGTNSLGWALVDLDHHEPTRLLRAGVRVFDAGMDGNIEQGREISRNQARREARSHRRQIERRTRRITTLFRLLQRSGLLPPSADAGPETRQRLLTELDGTILASDWFSRQRHHDGIAEPLQVLPYLLRAKALDEPLPPHFLGRAFYHLAQRRGFRSNRKEANRRKKDEEGEVKQSIAALQAGMTETGARTLGEYLSRLSPSEHRIRRRWTAREMYEREFDAIWSAQFPHSDGLLTLGLRKQIYKTIFSQRPLKLNRSLVGLCELEPGRARAPKYLPLCQRFRLLQNVNNLRIQLPESVERELTPEERTKLADTLNLKGDMTYAAVRNKLLGFPRGAAFSIESGGEKVLRGNRTQAEFLDVFGDRWLQMPENARAQAIQDVNSIESEAVRKRRALQHWALSPDAAEKFAQITLEPDYFNLSRKAMEKLLPLLDQGMSYAAARRQSYPERFRANEPLPLLPPVQTALPKIGNPAVTRSLSELRKVVNAIVRAYGRPAEIRIELARDLRNSKKKRQIATDRNRENERLRKQAARKIAKEVGIANPTRDDIRKVLLREEAGGHCPFTGKAISMDALFGSAPQFDFEHILPFSRSLDNSFVNLTLCYLEENRNRKRNQTPHEAYAGDPRRYEEILERVKSFKSTAAREKLRRFQMDTEQFEQFLADFSNRQLADTRYASRLAGDYLALLYGGRADGDGKLRIRVSSGQTTAYLRAGWKLNGILNDGPTKDGGHRPKTRDDHRHHAVDALVVALTGDGTIQQLSRAAERAPAERRRILASLAGPWPDFVDSVRTAVAQIIVSHRASRKVSGPLHEETHYANFPAGGRVSRVRKPLSSLTPAEVGKIVDQAVRRKVLGKLSELGTDDPKKAFATESNLPFFQTADGRRIPIRKARVEKAVPLVRIGKGATERSVTSEMNHHVEIYAELDEKGREKTWDGNVVSMLEAYQRKQREEPIVTRDHGPLVQFKFSLAAGDVLECDDPKGSRRLLVVRSISEDSKGGIQVGVVSLTDARLKKDIVASKAFTRPGPNSLRKWNARKVSVGPLGEITEAHD